MPRRVKLAVAYDGTAYAGWQVQPNGPTIQATMEEVFARILQEPVRVRPRGAPTRECTPGSRSSISPTPAFGLGLIVHGGNALLPPAIRILSASVVPETFDARRHATEKAYRYFLYLSPVDSPFLSRYAWHIEQPLDLGAMRAGLSHLVGEHDFSSFRGQGCNAISPVRTNIRAEVARHDVPGLIFIDVAGAGFLRHMVRNVVGTVVNAGKGKHSADHVGEILRSRDRSAAGVNAPPHGLFLWRVSY